MQCGNSVNDKSHNSIDVQRDLEVQVKSSMKATTHGMLAFTCQAIEYKSQEGVERLQKGRDTKRQSEEESRPEPSV